MKALKTERLIPRRCAGYDSRSGHAQCTKRLVGMHRSCRRCDSCKKAHLLHYQSRYQTEWKRAHRERTKPAQIRRRGHETVKDRTPLPVCKVCWNLTERRSPICKGCGLPYAPETVERGSVLQSSAGMAVGR